MSDIVDRLAHALAGRYRIERELGQGGMATVYLAEDLKHQRKVALKVLKEELGAVLGVERFLAEIRVTANLQHPNLLPLFDSGEADGLLFYVMPFIEGETLRTRLDRETVLSVDEAVRIASSMARALDYAHRQNVVHRDLKPENVMMHEGQPVIADFGIALAVTNAGGERLTQTGLSVGTPHYMSPEQAMGEKVIDRRSDVYALAALTYEMLAGEPPHTGPTAAVIISRVVMDAPRSLRSIRDTVPEHVDRAVARGLAKMPPDRWPTANEYADALTDASLMPAAPAASALRRPDRRFAAPALVAVAALVAAAWGWVRPAAQPSVDARFELAFADSVNFRTDRIGMNVAVSADGQQIAWLGGDPTPRIFVRALDDITPRPIPGTANAMNPQFSPDGLSIAFVIAGRLQRVALSGGPAATIADEVVNYSWGDNDVVVYSRVPGANAGLWRVSAAGGVSERLSTPDSSKREVRHVWPQLLPGAKAALFALRFTGSASEDDSIAVIRLADRSITRLAVAGSNPRYAPTGHLLFSRPDGSVRGVRFDPDDFSVVEPQVPVLASVAVLPAANVGQGGAMSIAFAANGTMVYQPGTPLGQLVRVDRDGRSTLMRPDTQQYIDPRVSRDGARIAMTIVSPNGAYDVWLQTMGGTASRFTTDGTSDLPSWSPDARRVAWRRRPGSPNGGATMWAPADGSGAAEVVLARAAGLIWSPTGANGYTVTTGPLTGANIERVSFTTIPARPTPFLSTTATETAVNVSPDGAWVAFVSNQTGRAEVYVCAAADPTNPRQISTHGGDEPVWSRSGRELFYRDGQRLIAAQIDARSGINIMRRDTVFADIYQVGNNHAAYDVLPDGRSFIMVRPIGAGAPPMIVFNWFDELRERMQLAVAR